MYTNFAEFLKDKSKVSIIQAENPDGDSLGSAIALEYLLEDKDISHFCPVNIPKYLHYYTEWSKISTSFDFEADGYIIVDTAAEVLLSKLLENNEIKSALETKPVFVLDHHETEDNLPFPHDKIIETLPACCDLVYRVAKSLNLTISKQTAENLISGILADTLGLTSATTTSDTFRTVAELVDYGANIAELEEKRREYMKKSPRIISYKADLIKRIDYFLDGELAVVHIPWDDIKEYSDEYNPNVLILEEMRMVEGVEIAIAVKTYPDGKLTGKIRTTKPLADKLAGYFGGGGHPYAAGFRTYDLNYENALKEINKISYQLLHSK